MITENLSTLKIHKLSQAQYDRELEAGRIDPSALYLTPSTQEDLSDYVQKTELSTAINTALAQAKASGEFDGPKGDSVGIKSITENTESGGTSRITFTDGKTLAIRNGIDGPSMDGIPSYWQTALDNGVKAINTALCEAGRNKSAFLFYSDAHWNYGSQMSPTLLKYLHKHTGMAKTFFGGDIVNDEATDYDTMDYLWEWRKQLKDLPNHHSVVGNHDDGNPTTIFDEKYVYGYLLAAEETPDIVRGDSGLYYYIDNPAEKTRYLCLDTGYKDLNSLSDAQAEFIKASLKSTPSGWHIVAVAHVWYIPDYDQYSVRPIPITGLSSTALSVATILDNYNARSGEFTNCGAKVEFCIGGHVHRDYVGTTSGGIPIIVVETDSKHIRSEFTYNAGTETESSVNGIIADYGENKVSVVRIGRGNSFIVDLSTGGSTDIPGGDEGGDEPSQPAYTNVLDTVGYQTGYRLNSSGKAVERADRSITGFINAGHGDRVYFKNVEILTSDYGCNIAHYTSNSEDSFISGKSYIIAADDVVAEWWEDGSLKSYGVQELGTEWVRFCFVGITEDSIITINEPIE